MKNNDAIDLMRLILCVFIITLHVPMLSNPILITVRDYFSRIGVPFFFSVSGYLIGRKLLDRPFDYKEIYYSQFRRILTLFFIWSTIYFPYILYLNSKIYSGMQLALKLAQQYVFLTPAYLWYLGSLIIAIALSYFFRKYFFIRFLFATILYITGAMFNTYSGLFQIYNNTELFVFLTTRNGLFFAWLLFEIGITSSKIHLNKKSVYILFLLSALVYLIEMRYTSVHFLNVHDRSIYFSLPLFSFSLIQILKMSTFKIKINKNMLLRKISSGVYLTQYGFISVLTYFSMNFLDNLTGDYIFILTVFLSSAFSLIIVYFFPRISRIIF